MVTNMVKDRVVGDKRGGALLGTILIVSMLMALGFLSLTLAIQEVQISGAAKADAAARHLAEAGTDMVMQWFHDPSTAPSGPAAALFGKQYDLPVEGPSFFDAQGHSQFTGTPERPDLSYDASRPQDNRLLNDPSDGWFRGLRHLGRIVRLKVYGPVRPGLLCTVDVSAEQAGVSRTVSVQLGAPTIPPLRAGIQVGSEALGGTAPLPSGPLPIWVHWGDMTIRGDAALESIWKIPVKAGLAPITGQSYAHMTRREDRWLDVWVGGEALFKPSVDGVSAEVPDNVHPRQDPFPGLRLDVWDYHSMKDAARLFGAYYVLGPDGLLYESDPMDPGTRRTPDEVFGSQAVGDHQGLVFVDTLDQRPPSAGNLGTLSLRTDYAEGLFVVNAHVFWKPSGPGRSILALSPPEEGSSPVETRVPADVAGIHLQGVLYAAGNMTFEGLPRVYGAVVVDGRIVRPSRQGDLLEVWYNHDLQTGLVRGIPLVYRARGTWRDLYDP